MGTTRNIDWSDPEEAGKALAGNWREFDCFAWHRAFDLEDADRWLVWYTSSRDAGLLEQSNEKAITDRLRPFSEGHDPDFVFERHIHWAVGYLDGFSIRVFKADGTITPAFEEFCRIKSELDAYPVLDEQDFTNRQYVATLENYTSEMWRIKDELPVDWQEEVYSYFSDNGMDKYTEDRDDRGGWAPREKIVGALKALGLLPTVVIENGVVQGEK
jgi:hypothetical protein